MTVYQEGQDIYFISNKAIEAGKELFYWYSKPYAQLIGKSNNHTHIMSPFYFIFDKFPGMLQNVDLAFDLKHFGKTGTSEHKICNIFLARVVHMVKHVSCPGHSCSCFIDLIHGPNNLPY